MENDTARIARQWFEEGDRNQAAPIHLCSPSFLGHVTGIDDGRPMDLPHFIRFANDLFSAFSDVRRPIEDLVVENDKVALLQRLEGKHTGDFLGVPATGNTVSVRAMSLLRIADGRIAELWGCLDSHRLMQQVGAIPRKE